jgi:hypothetical protein
MTPFVKYLLTWAAGFLMGCGVVFAMAKPVLDHAAAAVTQLSDQIQDLYSAGTVLYEDSPCGPGTGLKIPILNGGASITIGGGAPGTTGRVARWYIPMKIVAQSLNTPAGSIDTFDYINLKTGEQEHHPRIVMQHVYPVLPQ